MPPRAEARSSFRLRSGRAFPASMGGNARLFGVRVDAAPNTDDEEPQPS